MCVEPHHRPSHPVPPAVRPEPAVALHDPVTLSPAEAVTLTTLVDNSIDLLLADDPSPYKAALGKRLEQLHQSLSGWVLPRIFVTADGKPPPIMISFRPPE